MSSRISTNALHASAVAQMLSQQTRLARTQAQVSSGHKFETPAESPVAATQVEDLERRRAELGQYAQNSNLLTARLNMGEQSLASMENVLDRVRELALQANSAGIDPASARMIAAEIRSRAQELMDVANRRDANGEFLFAGYSTGTQPFRRETNGVVYAGDQGVRGLQIGANQKIADSFSGAQTFVEIPEGNGTFATAQGVHTGTGSIDTGQLVNAAAWVRGSYTITFTTASAWEVRNAANALVATGPYTDGGAISFNGVAVTVTGEPAANDTFTIAPSGTESLFDTFDALADVLTTSSGAATNRASVGTAVARALTQLDQGLTNVGSLRAEVGARLSAIDSTASDRDALDDQLSVSVSSLRDIDYAEAISRMNQQLTGLQAAQAAYARISQLSLFDYL